MKINEVVRKQVLVIYRGIGKGRLFRGGKFRWMGFDLLEKQEITRKRKKNNYSEVSQLLYEYTFHV